jgi:hypothetical protein
VRGFIYVYGCKRTAQRAVWATTWRLGVEQCMEEWQLVAISSATGTRQLQCGMEEGRERERVREGRCVCM